MGDSFLNKKFKMVQWNASAYLIAINVAVFLATNYLDIRIHKIPLMYWMGLFPPFVHYGFIWQFVTYMFVHGSWMHLLFNMYALYMFGSILEHYLGSKEFLLFYFVVGILSSVFNYLAILLFGSGNIIILGASGAIYGMLLLVATMFPMNRVLLFFIIPVQMPLAILIFIVIEVFSQITGTAADIAHLMHLCGIAIAWVYCLVRFRISPYKVFKAALSH